MLRLTLRNLLARKVRLLMSGLAIVLGVAFLSGVLVFSHGLSTTFDSIIEGTASDGRVRVAGSTSFSAGELGTPTATLQPADVERLAALPEVDRADGQVDGFGLNLLDSQGAVVGGTGAPTLAFNRTDTPNLAGERILLLESGRWPERPGEVALDAAAADRAGYELGDEIGLLAPYGQLNRSATLVGVADFNGGGTAGATLVIFDTAGAQQVFLGGRDAYTSVALTAADGVSQRQLVAAAETVLPEGFEAVTGETLVEESKTEVGQFLGVISTFLLAFAVIAVVVGAFIIVNTFSILVAQRTRELALLRALGATRRQVSRTVLAEAGVLALIATTIGIGLGWGLARGLGALFSAFGLEIAGSRLQLTTSAVVISYAVGVLVTLVAAWMPSRRAGRVAPVAAMAGDTVPERGSLRRRGLLGAAVLLVGAGLAVAGLAGAPGPAAAWVGGAALLWVLTVAAISPVVGHPVLTSCRSVFARFLGPAGRLAGENALRDPRRTGSTASALMIGLAVVSAIGVLTTSFVHTIDDIVDGDVKADFMAQKVTWMPFSTAIGDEFARVDGVAQVGREQWIEGSYQGENVSLTAVGPDYTEATNVEVSSGRTELQGAEILLSSGFADEHGLRVGDTVPLDFPGGAGVDFTVVGIDAATDLSETTRIPLDQVEALGLARQDNHLSVLLEPGADPTVVRKALDDIVAETKVIAVYDRTEYAAEVRGQVNQLVYLIYGLLALAILIAIFGIVNTLGLSVIERTREIGLLRAIGMSRRVLRRMITLESVAIAVLGAVLGMVLGVGIGVLLRQALSDQVTRLGVPVGQLVGFLVVAVVVGVLAAVLPSIRAARLDVLTAIATE